MSEGYPPLEVPKELADGVWVVDAALPGTLEIPIRMTVLRLRDGGLWLHSPTQHRAALHAAVEALGPIRHLVAPDSVHWLGIGPWQAAVPRARCWGAPGIVARLAKRNDAPRFDAELGPDPPPEWAGEIDHAILTAPGFAEVAFLHRPTRTLILTDTVQAMEPARLTTAMRFFARLSGSTGKGGAPFYLRWAMRWGGHRTANRAVIERLVAWQPERVIFAHGTIFEEDATARLKQAFAWALRS
ncbi:DUF4336 domain-containing protein [Falsiroseomonas sp. HW251]|uniref:DUF4336 domain-containing protein n=1 Tax=Falsiroseomonas sp. HW251 TaxID=3390998 RepID=UPI003D323D87